MLQYDGNRSVDPKHLNGNGKTLTVNATSSLSNASNSSRRSSWSSKTEGVQTVIEYPMEKSVTDSITSNGIGDIMNTSTGSLKGAAEEKTELIATKIVLNQIKVERDQLKSEIGELQKQLSIAQNENAVEELRVIVEQLAVDKEQLQERVDELESANSDSSKNVSDLEGTVAKLRQIEMDLNEQLSWAKSEAEHANSELQQYRSRAQHTLQMKDEIIAELKLLREKTDSNDDIDTDSQIRQIELGKLEGERISLIAENESLRSQLHANKQVITSLEAKYHECERRFAESEKSLTNALKQEKLRSNQMEEQSRMQTKELKAVTDELKRHQFTTSSKLHEKENEILNLRAKLSQQSLASSSLVANSADDRIHSLTQSLVQKQNALETMTADRNAIRFQLEKLENQHRETMQLLRQQRLPQIINVNDTDDAKSLLPNFMRENPFDTRVARRMKRAYSSLDAAGIRLGVFLRRYPIIRTMVIVYVAILHLWVMFVLLSSTPN